MSFPEPHNGEQPSVLQAEGEEEHGQETEVQDAASHIHGN